MSVVMRVDMLVSLWAWPSIMLRKETTHGTVTHKWPRSHDSNTH